MWVLEQASRELCGFVTAVSGSRLCPAFGCGCVPPCGSVPPCGCVPPCGPAPPWGCVPPCGCVPFRKGCDYFAARIWLLPSFYCDDEGPMAAQQEPDKSSSVSDSSDKSNSDASIVSDSSDASSRSDLSLGQSTSSQESSLFQLGGAQGNGVNVARLGNDPDNCSGSDIAFVGEDLVTTPSGPVGERCASGPHVWWMVGLSSPALGTGACVVGECMCGSFASSFILDEAGVL